MKSPKLLLGDIFNIHEPNIIGDFFAYGNVSTKVGNVPIPLGTYYVLEKDIDKEHILISNVEVLQEGYYLLGKSDIYRVHKEDLSECISIDKIPHKERKSVLRFLEEMNSQYL